MSRILAVEASAGSYCVAVGTGGRIAAQRELRRTDPEFRGLGELSAATLSEAGVAAGDLDYLAVDVGPGNLSSVRAAVSYVNGLAFSLDRRIFCASSLDLMATEYYREHAGHLLCVRKASGGQAYLALYDEAGTAQRLGYGPLEQTARAMTVGLWQVAVAGAFRAEVGKLLTGCSVTDSMVEQPQVRVLYESAAAAVASDPAPLVAMAEPLNEGSRLFHDPAATAGPARP